MATKKSVKSVKDKVKNKIAKMKAKVKGKLTGSAVAAVSVALFLVVGCFTDPASRATSGYVRITVSIDGGTNSVSNTVNDVGMASADSEGSTETQSATPTWTFPIKVDARYNDAIAGATAASKGVLSSLGSGLGAVLDMMASGKSGTVKVTKKDGTAATVQCTDGQCSFCGDCGDK